MENVFLSVYIINRNKITGSEPRASHVIICYKKEANPRVLREGLLSLLLLNNLNGAAIAKL